jgi:hypothetical protein
MLMPTRDDCARRPGELQGTLDVLFDGLPTPAFGCGLRLADRSEFVLQDAHETAKPISAFAKPFHPLVSSVCPVALV